MLFPVFCGQQSVSLPFRHRCRNLSDHQFVIGNEN